MNVSMYLRQSVWDFILVSVCAVSLSYVVLHGFYIDPTLQYGPIPALIVLVLVLFLFVIAANKKFLLPGGVAYGIVIIVGAVVSAALSQGSLVVDEEGNRFIFFLVIALIATLCFLLSRNRTGAFVLLVAGIFTCGWVQFFYESEELFWTLAFLVATLVLIVYKNYQLSARGATSVRKVSFSAGFATGLGAAAVVVALGALVYVAVIMPLNPGVLDLKLITEYRTLEVLEVHGTSTEYQTPDVSLTSDDTNEAYRTTDDLQRSEDGIPTPARAEEADSSQPQFEGSFAGIDISSLQDAFDFVANPSSPKYLLLLLLLIPLAIIAYFVGRRLWRKRRLNRICENDATEQVRQLYPFFIDRLSRVGIALPVGATPTEFANNNQNTLARFNNEAQVDFTDLTKSYTAVVYGNGAAQEEEANKFVAFYQGFWKAARKQLGNIRYFFKSFRL